MGAAPFLGEIMLFAGNFPPRGWAFCNGQVLAISQNDALYALIGTTYGGDGQSTFALPDLRSRVPIHMGQGPGLSNYIIGQKAGTESVSLTSNQLPQHSHAANAITIGTSSSPAGQFPSSDPGGNVAQYKTGAANAQMNALAISGSGGGQPHLNLQPLLVLNFCIALEGVFPSRN